MIYGTLIKRYKRFLADVALEDGSVVTAHCPNSGRMTGCNTPGWKVALSESDNPKRKLKYTLEFVHNGVTWICVHAAKANEVAFRAIEQQRIPELSGYESITREVKYGEGSRVDLYLHGEQGTCYVEVKSCTMVIEEGAFQGTYSFPDAPTERGRKHLEDLRTVVKSGSRGVLLFVIQREDGVGFVPAWDIDPDYSSLLEEVRNEGVEVLCYQCRVDPELVVITDSVYYRSPPIV